MISDAERERIEALTDDELAVEFVVLSGHARRLAREVERVGRSGLGAVRPTDAKGLIRHYLDLDEQWEALDDRVRERFA